MQLVISDSDSVQESEILELYCANQWSAAEKPQLLLEALNHSHSLVTARIDGRLVGLGNAISDGYLVMYFPIYWFIQNYKGRALVAELCRPC